MKIKHAIPFTELPPLDEVGTLELYIRVFLLIVLLVGPGLVVWYIGMVWMPWLKEITQ